MIGKGLCEEFLSSFDIIEEVELLIEREQPTKDGDQNNWIQNMSITYASIDRILFRKDPNGVLLRCIK